MMLAASRSVSRPLTIGGEAGSGRASRDSPCPDFFGQISPRLTGFFPA